MRANWSQKDLAGIARGNLRFTRQEAELMRAAVFRLAALRTNDAGET